MVGSRRVLHVWRGMGASRIGPGDYGERSGLRSCDAPASCSGKQSQRRLPGLAVLAGRHVLLVADQRGKPLLGRTATIDQVWNEFETKDLPGTGLYIQGKNQMVVWEDERMATKNDALVLLDVTAHQITDKVEYIDWQHDPKALEAIFRRTERGLQQVIPHEASHWVAHTLLSGVLPNDEPLTPCLDEGFAVTIDRAETLASQQLARGAGTWESVPRAGSRPAATEPPAAPRPEAASEAAPRIELFGEDRAIDWPRFWFAEGVGVEPTPAGSLAMAAQHLYEGTTLDRRHAYAECYVLARLFGTSILAGAIAHRRGLAAEVADLHVPWHVIRGDIASGHRDEFRGPSERR
jgi:hypothetical protein